MTAKQWVCCHLDQIARGLFSLAASETKSFPKILSSETGVFCHTHYIKHNTPITHTSVLCSLVYEVFWWLPRSASCLSFEPCTRELLHFGKPKSVMFPCLCLLGEGIDHHVPLSIGKEVFTMRPCRCFTKLEAAFLRVEPESWTFYATPKQTFLKFEGPYC